MSLFLPRAVQSQDALRSQPISETSGLEEIKTQLTGLEEAAAERLRRIRQSTSYPTRLSHPQEFFRKQIHEALIQKILSTQQLGFGKRQATAISAPIARRMAAFLPKAEWEQLKGTIGDLIAQDIERLLLPPILLRETQLPKVLAKMAPSDVESILNSLEESGIPPGEARNILVRILGDSDPRARAGELADYWLAEENRPKLEYRWEVQFPGLFASEFFYPYGDYRSEQFSRALLRAVSKEPRRSPYSLRKLAQKLRRYWNQPRSGKLTFFEQELLLGMRGMVGGRSLADFDRDKLLRYVEESNLVALSGLEEARGQTIQRVKEFLSVLVEQAERGMTPIVIGQALQARYSELEGLQGLEKEGIFLYGENPIELFERLEGQDSYTFIFAGPEEETNELIFLAQRRQITFRVITPDDRNFTELILGLLSRATDLREAVIAAQEGFTQFLSDVKQLAPSA